jgi:hypothetical protein
LPPGAQLRVEASGRVWTLRLIDAQHDYPAVELLFEHVDTPEHRTMNLRIYDSNLTRDHVIAWLRSHLSEEPAAEPQRHTLIT